MLYRLLGRTGVRISVVSFGAGPISTLMVGEDEARQSQVVEYALRQGINWFDTAATYGQGRSERNLGRALQELGAVHDVHVATKVRLMPDDLDDICGAVARSFEDSLTRLRMPGVTLLQLHNSITRERSDEPTSITPDDVLKPGGVLDAFKDLQNDGVIRHIGLTGIGDPQALREVINSGRFDVIQVPYHLLNPSAGQIVSTKFPDANYGNILADCAKSHMGTLAIRVLAGGALADNSPSPHTHTTPFFTLSLYERDRRRAAKLRAALGPYRSLHLESIRFVLSNPDISSALIGFGDKCHIDDAMNAIIPDESPMDWQDCWKASIDGEEMSAQA